MGSLRYPLFANVAVGIDDGREPRGWALGHRLLAAIQVLLGFAFLAAGALISLGVFEFVE